MGDEQLCFVPAKKNVSRGRTIVLLMSGWPCVGFLDTFQRMGGLMKAGLGDNSFRAMRLTTSLSEMAALAAPADVLEPCAVTGGFSALRSPHPSLIVKHAPVLLPKLLIKNRFGSAVSRAFIKLPAKVRVINPENI